MYGQALFLSDSSSEDSQSPEAKAESKFMRKEMKGLFESDLGKDFDIVVGDSRIKVHKLILMMNSPVFKTMMFSGLKESTANELLIEDFDFEVVEQMIEAVYKGKPSKLDSMAKKLLEISNKYELNFLKMRCEKALIPTLSVANLVDTLVWADKFRAQLLEEASMEFLKRNYVEVRKYKDWKKILDNPNIHSKITDFLGASPKKRMKLG